MFSIRTAKGTVGSKEDDSPEWLQVIWKCNEIDPSSFLSPDSVSPWWAGGEAEEYTHFRVLHREDPSVSVIAKTEHGERILRQAASKLGIHGN